MEWNRTDAFGWEEFNFYNNSDHWIGSYIPKKNKVNIDGSITKDELEFIYNVIKHR